MAEPIVKAAAIMATHQYHCRPAAFLAAAGVAVLAAGSFSMLVLKAEPTAGVADSPSTSF